MRPDVLLALIGDLYAQVVTCNEEKAALVAERDGLLERINEQSPLEAPCP